jgi:hypothetical protein
LTVPRDFEELSLEKLDEVTPHYDLHNFAHQAAATLCLELYGSRYFSSLAHLPPAARQSITSSGLLTADKGPKCSDGVVFSQFLAGLFSNVVPEDVDELTQTYAEVTEKLARQLVAYLLARRALLHPAAGKIVHVPSSINMVELAVLVQNNRYKLPASGIEQRVFVRGGLQGDARDILDGMGVVARAELIAGSRK